MDQTATERPAARQRWVHADQFKAHKPAKKASPLHAECFSTEGGETQRGGAEICSCSTQNQS